MKKIIKVRKYCKGNRHGGRASLFKNQLVLPKPDNHNMKVKWGSRHDEVMERFKKARSKGEIKEFVVVPKN